MKHLLVIRLSAMGDVAMTVPVIRALVQQHPEVRVTVLSRPFFKPFFENIDHVQFFEVDVKGRHKGLFGIYRLYRELQKLSIDGIADLHNVLRSKILRTFFKLSGTTVAYIDKGRAEKKALTRAENKVFLPVKSMIERHVDTFMQLGFSIDISQVYFPEKQPLTSHILQIVGTKDDFQWIGVAPFAQYDTKVYPYDLMAKTIELLAKDISKKIFLFGGGAEEIKKLNQLQQNYENVYVVAGKLNFSQELLLIQHLDIMLSMDSGNAHIAAMYGIKVVTLWGHTHPYAGFVPFGQPLSHCITADRTRYPKLPTSVYGNKMIDGYQDVMRTIDPSIIVNKINDIV